MAQKAAKRWILSCRLSAAPVTDTTSIFLLGPVETNERYRVYKAGTSII
jgi:hypothetical protein